jgi:hypothetical protein
MQERSQPKETSLFVFAPYEEASSENDSSPSNPADEEVVTINIGRANDEDK